MRIAFITDMHLGAEGETQQGVDVRQNFLKALAFSAELKPNCLVIGGDISNTAGDRTIYEWVKKEINKLPFSCYIVPGNHDDSALLSEVFNFSNFLHGSELYYALPLEGRPVLFLDSSKGDLSPAQWTWFREHLMALRDNNVLIFMHHPPIPADVVFMDRKYPFQQSEQFLELTRDLPCHVTVICGHYHVEKIVQRGSLLQLLTPSTFYQIKQDTPDLTVDNYSIGVREINLTSHGTNSTVHYLNA